MRLSVLLLLAAGCAEAPSGAAALAIRDAVPRYQQIGTELFTRPQLESAYAEVVYLTEAPDRPADLAGALDGLLARHDAVDLFLLAHGNRYVEDVRRLAPERTAHLRLVYDTGPTGALQAPLWLAIGADAHVGHGWGSNAAPLPYGRFLPAWIGGARLDEAVAKAGDFSRAWLDEGASGWVVKKALGELDREVVLGTEPYLTGRGDLRLR